MMDDEADPVPARRRRLASGGIQAIEEFPNGLLLTADDLNELVEALKELDRRLSLLEEG